MTHISSILILAILVGDGVVIGLRPGYETEIARFGERAVQQHRLGRYAEAFVTANQKVALVRKHYAVDSTELGDALDQLGKMALYAEKGQEAIAVYEECLQIRVNGEPLWKKSQTVEDLHYAKRYATLTEAEHEQFRRATADLSAGYRLSELGRTEAALDRLERGIRLRIKALGYADSMVAEHAIMRSHVLIMLGRRQEGIKQLEDAIETQRRLTGNLHRHIASALALRSNYEYEAGELGEAEESRQRAATIYDQLLGLEHETTENTLSMLLDLQKERAAKSFEAAEFQGARAAYERAIQTATKRWGASSWRARELRGSLENVLFVENTARIHIDRWNQALNDAIDASKRRDEGNFAEAVRLFEKARDAMLAEDKGPKAVLALCVAKLTYCHFQNKQENQALNSLYQYIELARESLGLDHPDVVEVLDQFEEEFDNRAHASWENADVEGVVKWFKVKRNTRARRYPAESWQVASSDWQLTHWKMVNKLPAEEVKAVRASERDYKTLQKLRDQSEFKDGKPLAQKVVDARTRMFGRSDDSTIEALHALGYFQERTHDARTPETYREVIAECAKQLGPEHPRIAFALENLAMWYRGSGAYESARDCTFQRISIVRRVFGEYHPQTARALIAMASLALHEDSGLAYEYQRQAEKVLSRLEKKDPRLRADLDNVSAKNWREVGDYELALMSINRAIEQWQDLDDKLNLAIAFDNRAAIYAEANNLDAALKSNGQAVDAFTSLLSENHPTTLQARMNRVVYLTRSKKLDEAVDLAEQVVRRSRENLELHAWMGEEQRNLEMYESHRKFLDLFLQIALKARWEGERIWREVLLFKGLIVREQFTRRVAINEPALRPQAIAVQQLTSELAGLALQPPPAGSARERQSELKKKLEERESAELALNRAACAAGLIGNSVTVAENELRKILTTGTVLIDFHVNRVYVRDVTPEHSHVHAFILTKTGPVRVADFGEYGPIETAIQEWRTSIQDRQNGRQPSERALSRLREVLAVPLEAAIGEAQLVLYSPDAAIGQIPFAAIPAKEAGEVLLKRAAFVCVPVPQMLPDLLRPPEASKNSLLLLGDVNYGADPGAPAENIDLELSRGVASEARFDLQTPSRFPELKGAAGEIQAIGQFYSRAFGHDPEPPLRRGDATEANLRQRITGATYIHFVTHGFFSDPAVRSALANDLVELSRPEAIGATYVRGHPGLMSGIALAGANLPRKAGRDDGILTAAELAELDMRHARVAVLSACETGLGDGAGGEGAIGLQRALHTAGARTVVSTLWRVPDRATQALMIEVYRRHWVDKLPMYLALHEAQKAMRDQWNPETQELAAREPEAPPRNRDAPISPYYWAGFVVSGSWK